MSNNMNFLFTNIEPWIWLAALFTFLVLYAVLTVFIINKFVKNKKKSLTNQQITMLYMALKVVRLLIFIGIVLVYMLVVKIESKRFALVAIVIYLIYLLFDTLFLSFTEKQMKKK